METIAYRLIRRARRDVKDMLAKVRDCFAASYAEVPDSSGKLLTQFSFLDRQFIEKLGHDFPDFPGILRGQADEALAHRFNLLGSGPVVVKHAMKCRGMGQQLYVSQDTSPEGVANGAGNRINKANQKRSLEIERLLDSGYSPIDWQIDFKSGYRWSERTWYRDIRFGDVIGVDVKVPWELSRMQQLPVLGLAACFAASGQKGFEPAAVYAREFRNQVLDFMAANPPRFGVNWACAMDVAIRVANWLVAYDLVLASGVCLGEGFDKLFVASVRSHARHIAANLEWSPRVRGNHYIANIVGILFASAYLPCGKEADRWLAFSVRELVAEVEYQFHEDGSNFEGSVCYHRLSAEMVLWGSVLALNLSPIKCAVIKKARQQMDSAPPLKGSWQATTGDIHLDCMLKLFPDWYWQRIACMAMFTDSMTKPNGLVAQFGDNDSGRFISLGSGEQMRAGNDVSSPIWSLDQRGLIAMIQAVVSLDLPVINSKPDPATRLLAGIRGDASGLTKVEHIRNWAAGAQYEPLADDTVWIDLMRRFQNTKPDCRFTTRFEAKGKGMLEGLQLAAYAGMGVYVARSPHFYMAVRCGEIGLAGLGGHSHCDQLGLEISIDDVPLTQDPGTFVYTPFPERRNAYRSSLAHHVPRVMGREPADLTRGIFDLRDCGEGKCLYFGRMGFIGCHSGYGSPVYRIIELMQDGVMVHDFSEGDLPISDPTPESLPYSQGYGLTMHDDR